MIINPISLGGNGLLPEIIVTAPSGSTLDLIQDSVVLQTYTLLSSETQHTFIVKNTGTYTINATDGVDITSKEIVIDIVGRYEVKLSYFNYGDGSKNATSLAYEGILRCNGKTVMHSNASYHNNSANFRLAIIDPINWPVSSDELLLVTACDRERNRLQDGTNGDLSGYDDYRYKFLDNKGLQLYGRQTGGSGTNTFTFSQPINGEYTVYTYFEYGALTTGIYLGSLKYVINGTAMTLSEMVSTGACKPLVIISSNGVNGGYYFPNSLNLYTGGNNSSGNYPALRTIFMLNEGFELSGCTVYASKSGNSNYRDGLYGIVAFDTDDFRLTIEE